MIIYKFDEAGEYVCEVSVPDGTGVIPADHTWSKPLPPKAGMKVKFDPISRSWFYRDPDYQQPESDDSVAQ